MKSIEVTIALCMLLLSGCATREAALNYNDGPSFVIMPPLQTSNNATDESDKSADKLKNPDKKHIVSITPLSKLNIDNETMDQPKKSLYSNAYTRLLLVQKSQDGSNVFKDSNKSDEIGYEDRGALARLFWGTHNAYALSTKVVVGNFEATVPLVTMDHLSNRNDGEKFLRIVYHRANAYPLFLIKGDGSNAIASIKVQVNASDSTESSIVSSSVQLASALSKVLVPQSSVLTKLTEQQTKDVATAIESTINKAMYRSVDEEQWYDRDVNKISVDKSLSIEFKVPKNDGGWTTKNDSLADIGEWYIQFEMPRRSIFTDISVCNEYGCPNDTEILADVAKKPGQVLSYPLINFKDYKSMGTVLAFLRQQSWWDESIKSLNGGNPSKDDATTFCRNVMNSIQSIDLNELDAQIVTQSLILAGPFKLNAVGVLKGAAACKAANN